MSVTWAFGPVVWMREGDRFKPLHYRFKNHPNHVLCARPPFAMMQDTSVYPPGQNYVWTDQNGDEVAQPEELTKIPDTPIFQWMDADLNLYGDGVIYRPTAVSDDGIPTYDFANPEKQPATGNVWTDLTGSKLWSWHDNSHVSLFKPDGTREWTYTGLLNWRNALNVGAPGPGTLWGATCPVGVVGRYSGLVSYFGTVDLVRDDGLFVAQVFEHAAKGNNGPHIFYVEFLAGQMVQPKGTDKIYILAGDQDLRVSEVIGLDTVKDLPGGVYRHTPELARQAADAWAAYGEQLASGQPLILARGGAPGLAVADPVGKTIDAAHGFQAKAASDTDNLYFHYNVTSPSELVNQVVDPLTTFRGGNLLDIQLGTDPQADPDRKTPAPGDIRLLISRRDGKTWAVIMQPKVAGFTGERIKLTSPTGFEEFDSIAVTDQVELRNYRKTANGFTVTVVVPRDLVGLENVSPGETLRMDVGYIFGNAGGTNAAQRAYWQNNSFTANVVNDIPHESRLEPAEWGTARIE